MAEVVLHQWQVSPFCAKVRSMLRHKSVAFSVENYHGLLAGKKANGFRVEAKAEIEAAFLRYMTELDVMLAQRDWLVGATPSIADIAVAAQVGEVVRTSHLAARIRALPRLSAWLARLAE